MVAHMRLISLICVGLFVWSIPHFVRADALRRAGQAVHGTTEKSQPAARSDSSPPSSHSDSSSPSPRRDRHESRRRSHHYSHGHYYYASEADEEEQDDEQSIAIARALAYVVMSPWLLPHLALSELNPHGYSVPVYPYADDVAYSVYEHPLDIEARRAFLLRMRLGATARNLHLGSGTVAAQIDLALPFALHVDYRVLGEIDGDNYSVVGLGNAELLYRFADSRELRFHSGVGYLQWADVAGLQHGVALIYGFEAYPIKPISFGSRFSIGMLGHTYAFQWRSHLGVTISRYEVQLAYDHLDVGGVQLGGVQLSVEAHL